MRELYRLAIIHSDRPTLCAEVRCAAREAVEDVLKRDDLFEVTEAVSDAAPSNAAVAYLASVAGAASPTIDRSLSRAVELGQPILPIYCGSDAASGSMALPDRIKHINAVDWEDRSLALAALLRVAGIVQDERRLFLSYVRRDSAVIAEQLHRALQERQFDVFLDRFSVPPGEDFQRWLTQDLADKAFMLLLESDGVRDSQWVQHEVSYALSHRVGVLAIALPGVSDASLAPVDEAFRSRLAPSDLCGGQLTEAALRRLLERIELGHAGALRRRREQLLGSLVDQLDAAGYAWEPAADWAVVATADDRRPSTFLVTPRSPRAEDLRTLDRVRTHAEDTTGIVDMDASLIHDVADVRAQQADLLDWIACPHSLRIGRLLDAIEGAA